MSDNETFQVYALEGGAFDELEENRDWWRTYARELLEESRLKTADVQKLENDVYMLEQLAEELRQDAKGYKASSERWKQNCEDIGKAAEKQEAIDEQLHIDLEHAMAQNKALVAHTLEIDDAIMKERERAYRENKAFQVEQAKEIENLQTRLDLYDMDTPRAQLTQTQRVDNLEKWHNKLEEEVEQMNDKLEVLWGER